MKKISVLLTLLLVFVLTSCEHVHNHSEEFKYDDDTHYYGCVCGDKFGEAAHEYTEVGEVTLAPTCTEKGIQEYFCVCGKVINVELDALGHSHNNVYVTDENNHWYVCHCGEVLELAAHDYSEAGEVVKEASCVEDGIQIYSCVCGQTKEVTIKSTGHNPVVDKAVEATCRATGLTEGSHCSICNEVLVAQTVVEKIPHVDSNNDITCDYEGCTQRILPKADSEISLFTAHNIGMIISTSNKYYVTGVVTEVTDPKNGVFKVSDEDGNFVLVRLPKDANGVTHFNWKCKVVLGDTIQAYGVVNKYSTQTLTCAKMEGCIVTILEHEHIYSDPDCKNAPVCRCGHENGAPLGHEDLTNDGFCDRCNFNMLLKVDSIEVKTNNGKGVVDTTNNTYTWDDTNFSVVVAKAGGGNLYKTSNSQMRLYKNNEVTIVNKNNAKILSVTIYATTAAQLDNFLLILTEYTYTTNPDEFSVTIEVNAEGDFVLKNDGSKTLQFTQIDITY